MRSRHSIIGLVALAVCLANGVPAAICDAASEQSGPIGAIVLHNGRLLEGRIERVGDRYLLQKEGVQMQIKAADVAVAAKDRLACYEHQRRQLDPQIADGHLQLAQWCVKYGLPEAAKREIEVARGIDPSHPKLALVERRLKHTAPNAPVKSFGEASRANAFDSLDGDEPQTFAEPSKLRAEQLDRFVRTLPDGALGKFTTAVQPILVNHCALAGCHGAGGQSKYVLERVSDRRSAHRRSTQRNLFATLQQVDSNQPLQSPLLTAPLKAHGSAPGPIFSNRESTQYQQIQQWAQLASGKKTRPAPAINSADDQPKRFPAPDELSAKPVDWAESADADQESDNPGQQPMEQPDDGQPSNSREEPRARRRQPREPAGSPDPFDPEIFNRGFFGE